MWSGCGLLRVEPAGERSAHGITQLGGLQWEQPIVGGLELLDAPARLEVGLSPEQNEWKLRGYGLQMNLVGEYL